jgi:hypothetical protein
MICRQRGHIGFELLSEDERQAYFSSEVARLVTQPLWPSRVPRWISFSVMINTCENLGLEMDEGGIERWLFRLVFTNKSKSKRTCKAGQALSAHLRVACSLCAALGPKLKPKRVIPVGIQTVSRTAKIQYHTLLLRGIYSKGLASSGQWFQL